MTAVVHNLQEMAGPLKQSIEESLPFIKFEDEYTALVPPKPVLPFECGLVSQNWVQNLVGENDVLLLNALNTQTVPVLES